ncbi:ATP-binding protein [Umezawaea sp. Da 62-37]|uniref:sensor histidine kinase n=1 Tax=Umezawaea sp. Da 62-37 TaxID=3075927 RepID=UPI0028F6EDF0|nr:ATP-binding protein [Umezawaea sp. Da 62-37]WNV84385.1 CHASE3 domain-containing protein [Umezawaea sp. Da 62-37]
MTTPDYTTRWPAKRLLFAAVAILILVSGGAVGAVAVSLSQLTDARLLVLEQIGPARRHVQELSTAFVNQETGVRGFALSGRDDFLAPYTSGQADERAALDNARGRLGSTKPEYSAALDQIEQYAIEWRGSYAEPLIAQVRARGPNAAAASTDQGKELFDRLRGAADDLEGKMAVDVDAARAKLDNAANVVLWVTMSVGALLILLIAIVAIVLYRILIAPLAGLAEQVRVVSSGDFAKQVDVPGPREIVMLGHDIDAMRLRILGDLESVREAHERLDTQSKELQRSNAELEQFAYVASHDLQEPLRKVASFCQLLERRYGGQLDERADQYIGFAVDGAKRMQVLINDLLAFSRVGRMAREHTIVDLGELVNQVVGSLSPAIQEAEASIDVPADLPSVRGEASLLGGVFQNLIGNALKFHGTEKPEVRLTVERTDGFWTFTCRDNGIGIDSEYAERIFVIFQRLHHKDAYPGTGIGLAMCRKIIEYHGGTIWLDTDQDTGTTFRFTLPVVEESETPNE